MIYLYFKVPENSWYLIVSDGFIFLHVAFCSMIKFLFLAYFLVNHLSHPVVSSAIFLLCKFSTFAYYMIYGFLSITTKSTFAILLRIIDFRFNIIAFLQILTILWSIRPRFYFWYPFPPVFFSKPSGTVQITPTTIPIAVTILFQSCFFLSSLIFKTPKSIRWQVLLFLII